MIQIDVLQEKGEITDMATQEYMERKRKYIQSYNKGHYKTMTIQFRRNNPEDMAIYSFLQSRSSTVQYIKDLAKAAMENEKKDGE